MSAGQRIVLVTGKGGVGKTTVATAFAHSIVRRGRRAALVEFGDGEAGARVLGTRSGVTQRVITADSAILAATSDMFSSTIIARAVTGNFAVRHILRTSPALRELAQLDFVRRVADEDPERTVVVDMPASGHGLAWLLVPQRLSKLLVSGPLHNLAQQAYERVTAPGASRLVLVTLPERLVLEETVELAQKLRAEMDMRVESIVINRIPPTVAEDTVQEAKRLSGGVEGPLLRIAALLETRSLQHREVQSALARFDTDGSLDPVLIPLTPADPSLDAVATWLEAGGAVQ